MKRIQQLSEFVINQIAAGEVIERPASVIKELVENSIDASSSKIEIEIANGGRDLRVSDNGYGIHKDDIKLAFSKHATSKIISEQDLWDLKTLGFRGEALASIVSISKLICMTKTKDSDNGTKVVGKNNGELEISSCGCSIGTTLDIKDLFYNVPARLKFLKKPSTEVANIIDTIQNIAIAHPEVAIVCKNSGKVVFKTSGSSELPRCLGEIFSQDILKHILMINAVDEEEKLYASGVVSDPTFLKNNRNSIFTIINGRFVKCPIISKAVERAYEDLSPSGKYPFAVINLTLPYDKVDVNVHPTKKEVRYEAGNKVFSFIHYAVKKALADQDFYFKQKSLSETITDNILPQKLPVNSQEATVNNAVSISEKQLLEENKPLNNMDPIKIKEYPQKKEFLDKIATNYLPDNEQINNISPTAKVILSEQLTFKEDIKMPNMPMESEPDWKVVGQAFNTFIILEAKGGLRLIDQHIASERTIYDDLIRKKEKMSGQMILSLETISISEQHKSLLEENMDLLNNYGYIVEFLSSDELLIKQVPQIIAGKDHKKIFEEIMDILEDGNSIQAREEEMLKTISCHAAVRAGDRLTVKEMELIIKSWEKTDFPYTCPHGRKICHEIPLNELNKFFGR